MAQRSTVDLSEFAAATADTGAAETRTTTTSAERVLGWILITLFACARVRACTPSVGQGTSVRLAT